MRSRVLEVLYDDSAGNDKVYMAIGTLLYDGQPYGEHDAGQHMFSQYRHNMQARKSKRSCYYFQYASPVDARGVMLSAHYTRWNGDYYCFAIKFGSGMSKKVYTVHKSIWPRLTAAIMSYNQKHANRGENLSLGSMFKFKKLMDNTTGRPVRGYMMSESR